MTSTSTMPTSLLDLLSGLDLMTDRAERIDFLISMSERYRPVSESIASRPFDEKCKIPGCESEVYLWAERVSSDSLKFHFAVENPQGISAMAMAAILCRTLEGASLQEIAALDPDIIYRIFGRELSMGKSMGLMGMVGTVRAHAQAALVQQVQQAQ